MYQIPRWQVRRIAVYGCRADYDRTSLRAQFTMYNWSVIEKIDAKFLKQDEIEMLATLGPELNQQRLWRYMSFDHFVFLIERKGLWFSSADRFDDSLEGSLTLAETQHRE